PARPGLINSISKVQTSKGARSPAINQLYIKGSELFVGTESGESAWFAFDLTKASTPQVDILPVAGVQTGVYPAGVHLNNDFNIYQRPAEDQWRLAGGFEDFGDVIYERGALALDGWSTAAVKLNKRKCTKNSNVYYLSVMDFADYANPYLLDTMMLLADGAEDTGTVEKILDIETNLPSGCTTNHYGPFIHSDDGIVATAVVSEGHSILDLVDTHIQDLVSSWPQDGSVSVAQDARIRLLWTMPFEGVGSLKDYLQLIRVTGDENGESIGFALDINPDNARELWLTPEQELDANTRYQLRISGVKASRRTLGLTDLVLSFSTAAYRGADIEWLGADKTSVSTLGDQVVITLANAESPQFFIGCKLCNLLATEAVSANSARYQVEVPPGQVGPVGVDIADAMGRSWSALGKFVYVKPLDLQSISPDEGTLEGYQTLELTADGLPPDVEQIQVYFGNQQAAQENFKLVANNRLQLLTPPGQLGKVSVRVVLSDGQEDILEDAYTYQQPIQSEIQTGQVTAMAIDPSATYMMVAAGQYLRIINIDPSAWTANNIEYDEDGQEIIRDPL